MRSAFLIWMCLTPSICLAQITGVIADTIGGRVVPGAVVTALNGERKVIARALADDSGRFRIESAPGARRIRIVKIGFRPAERAVTPPATIRVAMERLPSLLEPVKTSDQPRCSKNPTRPAAFGLWEQARAALLGAVIARETNSAIVTRINYRRYMKQPRGEEIDFQSVYRDSGLALRSFEAMFPAVVFMRSGFAQPVDDRKVQFFGPDAEVLLSDALVEHYCLEIVPSRSDRPTQVGLRFRPMGRAPRRVDVDGTLWIDTLTRALTDIEYGYLGLAPWATPWRPGGRIGFVETSPATIWIDRWVIRMTGAGIDSGVRELPDFTRRPRIVEGGAELASARWPDGRAWSMPLGAADIRLIDRDGSPLAGARLRLDSTDYAGVSDSLGRVAITGLLPGPYRISVFDSTLAVVDTALPASAGFVAERGKTEGVLAAVPTLRQFVAIGCMEQDAYSVQSEMFIGRVVIGGDSVPATGLKWRLELAAGEHDALVPDGIIDEGVTGSTGLIYVCHRMHAVRRAVLRVWPPGEKTDASGITTSFMIRRRVVSAVRLHVPR